MCIITLFAVDCALRFTNLYRQSEKMNAVITITTKQENLHFEV